MNSFNSRPFARNASKTFRPAFDYLSNNLRTSSSKQTSKHSSAAHRRKTTADSIDDTDSDLESNNKTHRHSSSKHNTMDRRSHSRHGSQDASLAAPVPLIDMGSRSASPNPHSRARSAAPSDDEDDEFELSSSIRPLVGGRSQYERDGGSVRMVLRPGGLGAWLFETWAGWQVWVGLLVFWTGGCGFGLLLMNRFIMLTGVYKFPFPLTGTYVQLVLTHVLLIAFSSLTRALASPLRRLGLGAAVAPAIPVAPQGGAYRHSTKSGPARFLRWLGSGSGGIAGGGLFEFDYSVAKQVLPLAVVFVVKVLLSNFSFAYAPLPVYQLARIGVTPLSLFFSCLLQKDTLSAPTLSAALIATLNLLFATLRSHVRVTWESIVAGVFSSVFAALYPILLLRTYRTLLTSLAPQSDVLSGYPTRSPDDDDNNAESRAFYRTLHYTSLVALALLTPVVLLSGEPRNITHNIPFLDVPFFWLMICCGAIGSWAVFTSTLLLVKATSPLSATFVNVPRSGVQLMLLSGFKMPAHSWVGVGLCWASSVWYVVCKRRESRMRVRLGGGR